MVSVTVLHLFIAALTLAGVLASISIWSPRRVSLKALALVVTALLLPLSYASFAALLSRPKPVAMEWLRNAVGDVNVLASIMREDEGIYLWLQLPDIKEPRAYVLPWNRRMAQQLQDAMRESEKRGSGVMMRSPFEPSWDNRDPKFYALPQPQLPPKEQFAPPAEHRHPSTDT